MNKHMAVAAAVVLGVCLFAGTASAALIMQSAIVQTATTAAQTNFTNTKPTDWVLANGNQKAGASLISSLGANSGHNSVTFTFNDGTSPTGGTDVNGGAVWNANYWQSWRSFTIFVAENRPTTIQVFTRHDNHDWSNTSITLYIGKTAGNFYGGAGGGGGSWVANSIQAFGGSLSSNLSASYSQYPDAPQTFTFAVKSNVVGGETMTVAFGANGPGTAINGATATTLPEPATMLLLGPGVLGVFGYARRRMMK